MIYMDAVRKAIESMYKDTCNVYEQQEITDPVTHVTDFQEIPVYADVKCKLSFSSITATSEGEASTLTQTVKLFIAPEFDIKPGSKISITHKGKTSDYKRSGLPAVYSNHQEIMLEPFERYA